jgi:hypothetical protein
MSRARRFCPYLFGAALVVSLAACGGSATDPDPVPTPTPVPTPPPPMVVASGGGQPLEVDFVGRVPFTTSRTGNLDATVDWTYGTNDLDVILTRGDCSFDQLMDMQCTVLVLSESETAKPEKVHADNAAAGTYTLFVANFGPGDESVSYQVVLTPTTAGVAPPSASSRGALTSPLGAKRPLRGTVELR